jgi:branched-chain amino acid transport system permease protein
MFRQTPLKTLTMIVLLAAGFLYAWAGGYFARELIVQAAALAILAIGLDLAAGYGGMISLCHGAIFGTSAYVFAAMTVLLGLSPLLAFPAAILAAALFGLAVGAVTSRTRGIFFIMATLAFGEMAHAYVFASATLGGDDGLPGVKRLDLSGLGIDLQNSLQFTFFALIALALAYLAAALLLRSGFGRTLVGIRSNETRIRALGLPVWRYKAGAFAFSGAIAGLAGAITAQHLMFVSPEMLVWTVSGEALVVVILGGLGTLAGPVLGAALFVFLKHEVSTLTDHWHMVVGAVLIATVMSGGRGIFGQIEHYVERQAGRRRARLDAEAGELSPILANDPERGRHA